MEYRGVLPSDAPDPTVESEARVRRLPFPVMQLRPQPALGRARVAGLMESDRGQEFSVSFTYTLWRHPEDHADPRNEIELDEATRRAIEEEPPWGRPAWLIEQAQMFRYPMLEEVVRTTWHANPALEWASVEQQLVEHTNYVLRNSFRDELGLVDGPDLGNQGWEVGPRSVSAAFAIVDDRELAAVHIDTDPLVYAIGFRISEQVMCTTAIPRDALAHVALAHSTYE